MHASMSCLNNLRRLQTIDALLQGPAVEQAVFVPKNLDKPLGDCADGKILAIKPARYHPNFAKWGRNKRSAKSYVAIINQRQQRRCDIVLSMRFYGQLRRE